MKYIYECIGTFFLMFTIAMVVIGPGTPPAGFAPLAIGTVLAVMIFAGGHVSGGHYNPAVSLAVFIRGRITAKDMFIYWIVQILGAAVAICLALYLKGPRPEVQAISPDIMKALLAEFVFTFALCYTVVNVATAKGTEGNSFYGWAIGMAVMTGAYSVGAISGGAFNPAVAVGITMAGISPWANIWIYIVANLAGGIVAGLVFKAAHPAE